MIVYVVVRGEKWEGISSVLGVFKDKPNAERHARDVAKHNGVPGRWRRNYDRAGRYRIENGCDYVEVQQHELRV